ncbi:MAG: DUF61 family protein [Thermoplasmata archaeon]
MWESSMTGSISEEGVLKRLLQQMNAHVPMRRQRLSELMEMSEPHSEGRDGRRYMISNDELLLIRAALARVGLRDVKIPIVLMADPGHERSTWRVEGEEECAVISGLLGREDTGGKERMFLYGPHMADLRRKLPTTTICLFLP